VLRVAFLTRRLVVFFAERFLATVRRVVLRVTFLVVVRLVRLTTFRLVTLRLATLRATRLATFLRVVFFLTGIT